MIYEKFKEMEIVEFDGGWAEMPKELSDYKKGFNAGWESHRQKIEMEIKKLFERMRK